MRLGLQATDGVFPTDLGEVRPAHARLVRELGFSGIGAFFGLRGEGVEPQDPRELTTENCREVREMLDDEGVAIAHFWAMWAPLMHPHEPTRRRAVATLQESCRVARDLGTDWITFGSGSASTAHGWAPHRENFTPGALERLIKSLREGVGAAEDHGVTLSLKGHVLTTVNTPGKARDVCDAVGSKWLRCGVDPVNWMTLEHVFDVVAWIDEIFATLDGRVGMVHCKDVILEDELVLHLTERPPGQGVMEYAAYLHQAALADPDGWAILEHTPKESIPKAREHLLRVAKITGTDLS